MEQLVSVFRFGYKNAVDLKHFPKGIFNLVQGFRTVKADGNMAGVLNML